MLAFYVARYLGNGLYEVGLGKPSSLTEAAKFETREAALAHPLAAELGVIEAAPPAKMTPAMALDLFERMSNATSD